MVLFPAQVVQLPQTIHYRNSTLAADDANVINALPAGMFHLMLREQNLVDFTRQYYPNIFSLVAPDAAFGLGPLSAPDPLVDVAIVLRSDHEGQTSKDTAGMLQAKLQQHNLTSVVSEWDHHTDKWQEGSKVGAILRNSKYLGVINMSANMCHIHWLPQSELLIQVSLAT